MFIVILIPISIHAIVWALWVWRVNRKFNKCVAAWEQAWRVEKNVSNAAQCYHAEEMAHEDMFELSPFAWRRKWNRDYLKEATEHRNFGMFTN